MKDDILKINITGDFCPRGRAEQITGAREMEVFYNGFHDTLKDSDISITNLEAPLTHSETKIKKNGPHIKAKPEAVNLIKFGGFNTVTLANNHILDYGAGGLNDTLKVCGENDIQTVGAGKDYESAVKPLYLNVKNRKIALLNYTENEFSVAGDDRGGANPYDLIEIHNKITEAKKHADIVLLIIHGGNEFYDLPNPRVMREYRFFAGLGVDAVISHHTHCYSGYEVYNGIPIFYGLGNFVFDHFNKGDDSFYSGYFVKLLFDGDNKLTFKLYPYYQFKDKTGLSELNAREKEAFYERLEHLNKIISQKELIEANWKDFCSKKSRYYLESLYGLGKIGKGISRTGYGDTLYFNEKNLLKTLNYINCQSHRDAVTQILSSKVSE